MNSSRLNQLLFLGIICIVFFLSSIILVTGHAKWSIIGFGVSCGFVFGKNWGFGGNCDLIKLLSEGPTRGGDQ